MKFCLFGGVSAILRCPLREASLYIQICFYIQIKHIFYVVRYFTLLYSLRLSTFIPIKIYIHNIIINNDITLTLTTHVCFHSLPNDKYAPTL